MHNAPEMHKDKPLSPEISTVRPANRFVDIVGVTSSILVTPTIQPPEKLEFYDAAGARYEVLGRFDQTWGGLSA